MRGGRRRRRSRVGGHLGDGNGMRRRARAPATVKAPGHARRPVWAATRATATSCRWGPTWRRRGCVRVQGFDGGRRQLPCLFFLQQLSTPTSRRAGVRRRRTATGAGTRAGVRTATGAAYAGGRMTSRADVRRRVGIPIPNVK